MDRAQLADFLRTRREALTPEDVGLTRGPRRRARGLRREEVASLSTMSVDYYSRIEQQRGPLPSENMLAAIARGLRLSVDERDHLFRLAGHNTPGRSTRSTHVSPGTMRILDRLADTPVQVITPLIETLVQTEPAIALVGRTTGFSGLERSGIYRWFTDLSSRSIYPEDDHNQHTRAFTADLRTASAREGNSGPAREIVDALLDLSPEFVRYWERHEVGVTRSENKRFTHPDLGVLDLQCQTLLDANSAQTLLVYTARPGTESADKLQLLSSIGERSSV